jgi:hypothetical protein
MEDNEKRLERPKTVAEQEAFNNQAKPTDAKQTGETPADRNDGRSGTPTVVDQDGSTDQINSQPADSGERLTGSQGDDRPSASEERSSGITND